MVRYRTAEGRRDATPRRGSQLDCDRAGLRLTEHEFGDRAAVVQVRLADL